jgi:hypothetical protein
VTFTPAEHSETGRTDLQRLMGASVLAVIGTIAYLPLGAVLFAIITFLAWKWRVPTWLRITLSCVLVVLLFLWSGMFTTSSGGSGSSAA